MFDREKAPDAAAYLVGGPEAPHLRGNALFYQTPGYVLVEVHVTGLPRKGGAGFFGLHIHQGGGCGGPDFSETGGHYDPAGRPHPAHAGDLPPLLLCSDGAWMRVRTDRFRVPEILGKTVVIHGGTDDFHSQPAGNAGSKIACGVIKKPQPISGSR